MYNPITLGLIAGITVYMGALPVSILSKVSKKAMGILTTFAAGILLYIALDVGSEAEELVTQFAKPSTLPEFFIAMSVTALALGGIWMAIQFVESSVKRLTKDSGLMMASTAALGLGVHNIGEGVGIAAALISGNIASALLFTIGFAVHNATEGFGFAGPHILMGVLGEEEAGLRVHLVSSGWPARNPRIQRVLHRRLGTDSFGSTLHVIRRGSSLRCQ